MSPENRNEERDAELRDLWTRRAQLNEREWARLCELVTGALQHYRPSELASLPEDHADYVQEYLIEKVFRTDLTSVAHHEGAVRSFFRNYLLDLIRKQMRDTSRKADLSSAVTESGSEDSHGQEYPDYGELQAECNSSDIDAHPLDPRTGDNDVTDVQNASDSSFSGPRYADFASPLLQVELTVERVVKAADTWLQNQPKWVPVYLGLHHCPDKEYSEPLYKLAKRLNIASHHYKAENLGIGSLTRAARAPATFAKTLIGQWLVNDVGLGLTLENRPSIEAALKILCFQALEWVDNQENFS